MSIDQPASEPREPVDPLEQVARVDAGADPAVVEAPQPETPEPTPVDLEPGLFDEDEVEDDRPPRRHHVTAVLVAHDGERWLPAVLTALGRTTRRPDRLVAVDTGSTDATPALLAEAVAAGLVSHVVTLARDTGFGAAVAAGVEASAGLPSIAMTPDPRIPDDEPAVRWLWLLHDDSAPASRALESLLRAADRQRSVEILGPKVRGWANRDVLLEAGVTVARSGNRVTGLERRELDQGQHDGDRDVLADGSAGMLVRPDVWDALDGFDAALPFFREDVDLCWRARRAGHRVVVATDAVVHHRAAASHHRRLVESGNPPHPERPERIDRASSIHLLRAHATGLRGPFVTLRLLLGSLVRAVFYLLGKAPDQARDEWGAFRDAVRDRRGLRASRRSVAAASSSVDSVPARDVRRLLAPRGIQARHAFERLADLVAGRDTGDVTRSVLDSTPDDPDGWYAEDRRPSRLRRALTRPGTLLFLGLLVTSLIGVRHLLGDGVLLGGALQPAPEGALDLWSAYTSMWHEVAVGSATDAPPWLVPLALVAGLMRGSASTAVDVLLLGCVPLAGMAAWFATRGLGISTPARLWGAATWASLPAVTGAVSGGRLGTAVALVLLPFLARSCVRLLGVHRDVSWRRAFGTGLLLTVVVAFTPVVWLMVAVLGLVALVTVTRGLAARVRVVVAVLLPVGLLVPWSLQMVRQPARLWLEPGVVGPVDPTLSAQDVLLLRPGGPGSTPLWLGIGLVIAGLACLGVPGRRRAAAAAVAVGFVGLVTAIVMTTLRLDLPSVNGTIAPWPGVATAVWAGALVLAVMITVDQIPAHLAGRDFGWRQPVVVVLVAVLIAAPVASLALLLLGADGPLRRGSREVVPAFVAAEMRTDDRPRALVLRRAPGGVLVYDLLSAPEPQLGDRDVAPDLATSEVLDRLVARLAAGIGASEVDDLADHGVRYLVLADARAGDDPLVSSLDSQRGLRRISAREGDTLWELVPVAGRVLAVGTTDVSGVPVRSALGVPTTGDGPRTAPQVATDVAAGVPGRELVLAEAADSRWRFTLDGTPSVPTSPVVGDTVDSALLAVPLGAPAARVTIALDASSRTTWLWVQAAVLALTVVLALPARRREDDDDDPEELDADEPAVAVEVTA